MAYKQMNDRQIFASKGVSEEPFEIKELSSKYQVDFENKRVYETKAGNKKNIVNGLYESLVSGKWSIKHKASIYM